MGIESLAGDQPEPRPEHGAEPRKSADAAAQAAAAGATGKKPLCQKKHSVRGKASGTNTTGVSRTSIFEPIATRTIEKAEVAMTTIGRSVTSRYERKSASRVALPAMNWPLTAAAQSIAIKGDEGRRGVGETILAREARSPQRVALARRLASTVWIARSYLARLRLEPPSSASLGQYLPAALHWSSQPERGGIVVVSGFSRTVGGR